MRIVVNRDLCSGHARCAAIAPDMYALDDYGHSALTELEVPPGREEEAVLGAESCPERCISLIEES